jgi:4,5-DOPA dioxygenase extradiol
MTLKDLYKTGNLSRAESGKMPVLFLGHGSPMNAIEENEFVAGFRMIGKEIPRPAAVLCVSAHWETRGTFVTAMEKPPTIHDFGGFPKELFEVQYPAPGDPELARQIKDTVKKTETGLDFKWGLDHGAWSVVKHLFPEADIPVLQMSLDYYQTIRYHYELASELSALRNRGVLIIGSGNMVHNLGKIAWERLNDDEYSYEWAAEASEELKKHILNGNHDNLINYLALGTSFRLAIPTPEHYLPLLYALALREKDEEIALFNDRIIAGSISMTSVRIGI